MAKGKRRANGEGCITQRKDGKWLIQYNTGVYKDGKKERIYKYARTQADALEILEKLKVENRMGVSHSNAKVKTGDWIDEWINTYKAPKIKPATLTSYRNNARLHIKPMIGEILLSKLETSNIKRCLDAIEGSASLRIKCQNIINGALKEAVRQRMILQNPCTVPYPKNERKDMRVLTLEEQERFIASLKGEYYRPMLLTYLYSGMRIGEGIPLTWADIDLEEAELHINKKAIIVHDFGNHEARQVVQNFLKTKSSRRDIQLTPGIVNVLKAHKQEQMEQAEQLGEEWSEDCLAFPNMKGKMIYSRNLQSTLKKILAKAKIEGATMHTLRHTYATRCFENGMDHKVISRQLGHAKVSTTEDTYMHVTKLVKSKEIDKLESVDKLLG